MPEAGDGIDKLTPLPADTDSASRRKRYSEDYADAYVAHIMMLDQFFEDCITDDEMKALFLRRMAVPIRTFEDHIRVLRQRNAPDKDLSTTEIKVRDGEEERAVTINVEVEKCEKLRLVFLDLYQDSSASKEKIDEAGKKLKDGLENLATVVSRTERDGTGRRQSF